MPEESSVGATLDDPRLITCIVPKGRALGVVQALRSEHGIVATNINYARGSGRSTPLARRGIGAQSEKEILTVVVPGTQADEIFEFIYREGGIDQPHGGIVFVTKPSRSSAFTLPDLPDEK